MVSAALAKWAGGCALAGLATTDGLDAARSARWRDFPVFVWFSGGPEAGPVPFATLAAAGLAGCNIEAAWTGERSAAARESGLDFYVDHLAGKGDLWLRPARFDQDRAAWKRDLEAYRPERPASLVDAAVRERLLARVDEGLRNHRAAAPLCWVLEDELSVTRGVNPMDYCFAPTTLAAFRTWLAQRHGRLAALNSRWGSAWRSWDDVVPPTTGAVRAAAAELPLARLNFAAWSDHREFMEQALQQLLVTLAAPVARADPGAPVGFTGGGFPSAFGGFDWARLAPALSLHEPYETGAAPELVHAFKRDGTKVLSTLFVPDEPAADWEPRELLARVARGDDGAVIWSSGPLLAGDGSALTRAGRRVAATVATARQLRRELVEARDSAPRIYVLVSQAAARAGWMVDSWGDGKTFPNRLTSYEADHSSSATAREGWVELLRAWGVPWRFFDEGAGVPSEARAAPGRSLVILTEAFALGEPLVAELTAFVQAGGRLIGDAHAALFDAALRGRDTTALESLFGVRRAAATTLADFERSVADAVPRQGPFQLARAEGEALSPAPGTERTELGCERSAGAGRTLYLDTRIGGCVRGDGREAALRATAGALRGWLDGQGDLATEIELPAEAIGQVHVRSIHRADGEWLLVAPTAALTIDRSVSLRARHRRLGRVIVVAERADVAEARSRSGGVESAGASERRLLLGPARAALVELLPAH